MIQQRSAKIKKSMQNVIGFDKVKLDLQTFGVLKLYFCCRIFRQKSSLKEKPSTRGAYFFLAGRDRLDKEMDVGFIMR